MYSAAFEDPTGEKSDRPGIEFNFSPSLAVVGSRVVLASNQELARVLIAELGKVDALAETKSARSRPGSPTDFIALDSAEIAKLVDANRELLISHTMVEESKARDEATFQVEAIKDALGFVEGLDLRSVRRGDGLELQVTLRTSDRHVGVQKGRTKRKKDL